MTDKDLERLVKAWPYLSRWTKIRIVLLVAWSSYTNRLMNWWFELNTR